ncbi:MAG TPA: OmpA family protein [Rhizomicrobium sp.]|jgi:outer membrane protein OmpA-like peptidoglycan-associated protein
MKMCTKILGLKFLGLAALVVLTGAAQAQPWRGAPMHHGPIWYGGAWMRDPVPYRDWHGRRQYWLSGDWRYYEAPPPRHWRVIRRSQDEVDYELPDSVLFALDSARISPKADDVLAEIAGAAADRPRVSVVVEGHTDTSGAAAHNQQLSQARAQAVAEVLARQGVDRARIRTVGLGESDLTVPTGDGVREVKNRRVVVRVIGPGRHAGRDVRWERRN